jgi:hypothetical protein
MAALKARRASRISKSSLSHPKSSHMRLNSVQMGALAS